MKLFAQNKKASFDYHILDRLEAGIVLTGDEVKSVRAGHVTLTGAYATIYQGELFLTNCSITPYKHAHTKREGSESRGRKLLVHKKELSRLVGELSRKAVTLLPLKIYANERNVIKVELGLCQHKKLSDKRSVMKERDIRRETERELKKYR